MSPTFRGVGLAELRRITAAESDGWLVDGLIPAGGVTMVIGAPFAGKSTLLASVAATVASGRPLAGRATRKGPVVLVYQDRGSRRALLDNLAAACAGLGVGEDVPIHVLTPTTFTLDDESHVTELRAYLDRIEAVALVLDSLRRVSSFDENRSADTSVVASRLAALSSENRRAVLPVHHLGKDGKIRGSTDLEAASESVLRLDRSGDDLLKVKVRHHAAADQAIRLRVERSGAGLRYTAEDGPSDNASAEKQKKRAVARALRQALETTASMSITAARAAVRKAGVKAANTFIDGMLAQLVEVEELTVSEGARGEKTFRRAEE